ncbi:MAG TPA: tetratricopeptide repeat protein [Gemmatimonadaceae bacterium]|nr:tetratricopeptide repeat protein [Gemmatimonadaceae bacterium]
MLHRSITLAVALLALAASATFAQKEPKRPKLPVGLDSNDARVYYAFAMKNLRNDPDKAADALYWTTRLDPAWADGFYARRIALLLTNHSRLLNYWNGDRRTIQSSDIKRIDSLFYHALTINPFVSQTLDRQLFESIADDIASKYERDGVASASEARYAIDQEMKTASPGMKAWLAYGDSRFDDALRLYAEAIHADKHNWPLRIDRARVFYQTNQLDRALTELNATLDDMRKQDAKDLIYVYQSKALTEQSIGAVYQKLGNADAAREAFGRALQEDLSYYPAHMQLAFMAIGSHDTATALTELDLAVQVHDDDPATRYVYGLALATTGKAPEAEVQLRKAIELDPAYAAPHFMLGYALEQQSKGAAAMAEYSTFLAIAPQVDAKRESAAGRIAALKAGGF